MKYALVFLCFVVAIAGCAKTSQAPVGEKDAAKSLAAPAGRGLAFL